MTTAHEYATKNHDRFLAQLKDLIRIPSVSTQPKHAADVQRAAEWLADDMRRVGFETVDIVKLPRGRHPLVLGTWLGAGEDAPTILIYCHYDVQPAKVEDGWHSDPFEPVEREGKLFARGATDSKVNVMTQLKAIESLLASQEKSPVNIKLILEGEEESGSENIIAFVGEQGDRLEADVCVMCDGGIIDPDQPSLIYGLRGIVTMELHVTGPERNLHSGHYGGNVHNPIQALAEIIAQLHDANGTVTVPGFYNEVQVMDEAERRLLAEINPWIEADWQRVANAPQPWGEAGYSLHERIGIRPTLEINGILGGYTEHGVKTVLPAKAMAKISCRLVPHQDPDRIYEQVRAHIAQITPPTIRTELIRSEPGAPAVAFDYTSHAMQVARAAYEKNWGKPALLERTGGSIPIAYALRDLVSEMVFMGYTYKGGQAHGPNEHIIIKNFPRGINTAIDFLQTIKP
jgi:acetylornithine deacetylase/succinyl-diaminopimelate desuccinylase-like protein